MGEQQVCFEAHCLVNDCVHGVECHENCGHASVEVTGCEAIGVPGFGVFGGPQFFDVRDDVAKCRVCHISTLSYVGLRLGIPGLEGHVSRCEIFDVVYDS